MAELESGHTSFYHDQEVVTLEKNMKLSVACTFEKMHVIQYVACDSHRFVLGG